MEGLNMNTLPEGGILTAIRCKKEGVHTGTVLEVRISQGRSLIRGDFSWTRKERFNTGTMLLGRIQLVPRTIWWISTRIQGCAERLNLSLLQCQWVRRQLEAIQLVPNAKGRDLITTKFYVLR
jgi:hypothetical protein